MSNPSSRHIELNKKTFADLFHHEVTAWLVLVLSIVITALGWWLSSQAIEKRANDRFSFEVRDAQERIQNRIDQYQQILRGGVAFIDSHATVNRGHWQVYVSSLDLTHKLPGVQGFAFAQRVNSGGLQQHENQIRAEGYPAYSVNPPGDREVYFPIILIEPFDERNQRAFGYDMFSEPVRREAMLRAMDTGQATVSGLVQLKQGDERNPAAGFLIYLPVYFKGADLSSTDARRQAIRGFVYSPFIAADLMQNVLGNEKIPLHFQLYDTEKMDLGSLIYDSAIGVQARTKSEMFSHVHAVTVPLELSGRTWTARFESTPEFDRDVHNSLPDLILFAGGAIDLLLFLTIYALIQQRKRQSASKAKSQFLANMSHEIRTPLNAILGFNTLLGEQVKDPQTKEYVKQVQEASEQLLAMVEDVLSFSQIEAGSIKIENIEFDLHERIRKTLRLFTAKAQHKGLQLEVDIDPMTPLLVKGDPARYAQVLSNLLNNAIKFSDRGQIRVKVQVDQLDAQKAVIRTEVHDEGIGFDVSEFERLIRPFEQADNTATRRFGGSGLGLAICKRLTELMGGELFVTSVPEKGSVFGFTLRAQLVYPDLGVADTASPENAVSLQGKKILVVEDNKLNQHVIKALLLKMQADVVVVDNGQMAVDAVLVDSAIDLVLMDIHMPVMNGIDAAIVIRQLPGPASQLPIVALTAGALPEDEQACMDAGMNAFLTKPVDVPKLRRVLASELLTTH
ncbi:CHASE domain-containing protein [Limnobacter alexandrii]|uniref:CHASE domain-containing protein n=1 Tax=Limnobacter alexandrii TaxID=2570352 RepID=UPI001108617D|nr:CHASE domain-containing protein [Limnobacter alexandrii]